MKIGCPNCGQHYEVDAGSLDRYFRCSECQTLFRGLNAKSIRTYEFKRKNSEEQDGEITSDAADTDAINEDDILQLVDKAEEQDESTESPVPSDATAPAEDIWSDTQPAQNPWAEAENTPADDSNTVNLKTYWLPGVAIVIIFLLILLCFILNSQLNDMAKATRQMQTEIKALETRVHFLEQAIEIKR